MNRANDVEKWIKAQQNEEPILRQINSYFNRGSLTKQINTTNPFRRGLTPLGAEAPLIDDRRIEQIITSLCTDESIYNGLLLHAITHLVPDLNNYHKLRMQLNGEIHASKLMELFELPNTIPDPFGSGRARLAAALCEHLRNYFRDLRTRMNR